MYDGQQGVARREAPAPGEEGACGMTLLVLFLLVVVGFLWMFNRTIKAGYGKVLFYVVWVAFGIFPVFWLHDLLPGLSQAFAWVWVLGTFGLLLWRGVK